MLKKSFMVLALAKIMTVMMLTGCSGEQTAEAGYFEQLADTVNQSVEAQQEATQLIVAALDESKLLEAEKIGEISDAVAKVDKYVDIAQRAATEAAKVYEEKRAEDPTGAIVEAFRKANAISTPVNPYAPMIDAGLVLATAIGAVIAGVKQKQLTTATKKYQAHKTGVESYIRSGSDQGGKLYDAIGEKRAGLGI